MFAKIRHYLVTLKDRYTLLSLIWHIFMRKKYDRLFKQIPDVEFVCQSYKKSSGHPLNLDAPRLMSEKICWLMLFYRNPLLSQCADKYSVREYVTQKGYASILNELYGVYDKVEDIDISKFPDKFVLKATHSSNRSIVCKDKKKICWWAKKLLMKSWLKENTYHIGREWAYDGIKPRIICERFLEGEGGRLLDYKIFCMNGVPMTINIMDVMNERNGGRSIDVHYTPEWKKVGTKYKYDDNFEKPENLDEMLAIARDLSAPFPQVRVDLYSVFGHIYLGELTFYNNGGHPSPILGEYEKVVGDALTLPTDNILKNR